MTSNILLTVSESAQKSLKRHAPYFKSDQPMHLEGDKIPTLPINLSLSLDANSTERGAQAVAPTRLDGKDRTRFARHKRRRLGTGPPDYRANFAVHQSRNSFVGQRDGLHDRFGAGRNAGQGARDRHRPSSELHHAIFDARLSRASFGASAQAGCLFAPIPPRAGRLSPWTAGSFEYVVKAQLDEFFRLYGALPDRIDGHHHMHLCANVLLGRLLPRGTLVRRNFSFRPGEKSLLNRLYRKAVDYRLSRRHRLVDFLFSLLPLDPPSRLQGIFSLASTSTVEVETHPINPDEYSFLMGDAILRLTAHARMGPPSAISRRRMPAPG